MIELKAELYKVIQLYVSGMKYGQNMGIEKYEISQLEVDWQWESMKIAS